MMNKTNDRWKEFSEFYKGKRVLLTGHTGFKGAWLSRMLIKAGAKVTGVLYGITN